jgi:hypothetical protein
MPSTSEHRRSALLACLFIHLMSPEATLYARRRTLPPSAQPRLPAAAAPPSQCHRVLPCSCAVTCVAACYCAAPNWPINRGCWRIQQHACHTERRWGLRGWSLSCFEVRAAAAPTIVWGSVLPWVYACRASAELLACCTGTKLPPKKADFGSCHAALSVRHSAQIKRVYPDTDVALCSAALLQWLLLMACSFEMHAARVA